MSFRRAQLKTILSMCLLYPLLSCGSRDDFRTKPGGIQGNQALVSINLTTTPETDFSYTASITGCDSGFKVSGLTEANATSEVPLGDSKCQFKIDTMTVAGTDYKPAGTEGWAAGDTYLWTTGTNSLRVNVVDVLDALIQGPQTVQVSFSVSTGGADVIVAPTATTSIDISETSAISLEAVDVATKVSTAGAGQFVFTLECADAVAGSVCDDVEMNTLKSSMIVDTTGAMDIKGCFKEINANGKAVTPIAGNVSAPNGGATTVQHTGPAPMYDPKNRKLMLLVSDGKERCKYYKVQIELP